MRIIKEPEVRKVEILDAAEKLFAVKGYEATSVDAIIKAVGLSKGAFYYYFTSKEEVLDKIIEKLVSEGVKRAEKIASSPFPVLQKLIAMIVGIQFRDEYKHISSIFQDEGRIEIRDRIVALKKYDIQYISQLSPCFGKVVEEGIEAGLFSTPFPIESARILLCVGFTLFDWDNNFKLTEEKGKDATVAFLVTIERVLGAKAGTLSEFQDLFIKNIFEPYFQILDGNIAEKQHQDIFTEDILNILHHSGIV